MEVPDLETVDEEARLELEERIAFWQNKGAVVREAAVPDSGRFGDPADATPRVSFPRGQR